MIIINLKGGLGNQMFQYAFGRAFSLKNDVEMKLDISGYPKQTLRAYGLSNFNIKDSIATDEEILRIKYPLGAVSKGWRFFSAKVLRIFHKDYEPELMEYRDDYYFDGFFQSEKYFLPIKEIIMREFTLINNMSIEALEAKAKMEEASMPVSLHIRRGDYASNPEVLKLLGVLPLSYYQQATDMITRGFPEATFFVFSDDIEWAKENLSIPYPVVYVSKNEIKDYEEVHLMSLCKHHIIANSSFSWWGAWLNPDPDKIVVAPKKWTNIVPDDHPNIIPEAWTRI